jgi:phosphatidylglycerophosphatase B
MTPTPNADRPTDPVRSVDVLAHAARWIVPAYLVLLLPLFVDRIDPGSEPWIDLTGTLALVAWWFAESGQTLGIVLLAAVFLVALATRPGPSRRDRSVEVGVMIIVSVVFLYGGNLLNDGVVKPAIGVARPDIVLMADLGVLGTDVDAFYDLSEDERSAYLNAIKDDDGFGVIAMRPEVRDHWVKETAYARPSGHALASMTFATFYLSMALAVTSGWRTWAFRLLVPWAVCVCLSRPILRVHWPADVLLGGLAGIVLGALAFVLTRAVTTRLESHPG